MTDVAAPIPPQAVAGADRLKWSVITAYGAPGVGAGYMYLLIGLYVMKFSTDILFMAPAVIGTIFGVSRVWDAVTDPLVGYVSDRTSTRLGRRRSWLLISTVPIFLTFVMVFSPPASLQDGWLTAWMAVGVIGFYAAATAFIVPHMSLGPELTPNYHERSRLYGLRHMAFQIGSILALGSMALLINAEADVEDAAKAAGVTHSEKALAVADAVRPLAFSLSAIAALVTVGLIFYAVIKLRERPDFQGRVNDSPFSAFRDVWQNLHARLVLVVTFIEHIGSAVIGILTLYVAEYVVGAPKLAPLIILSYMIPSAFSVPMWIPLSRRFGKKRMWMFSMLLTGISFGCMFSLPFIESTDVKVYWIFVLAIFAGLAAGCGGTIAPSVQSDIIDYDEYRTGERKEGSYFAAFNFVHKSATGVMILITGWVMQFVGYDATAEQQTMMVQIALVALYGLFPLVCYIIGTAMFSRFTLTQTEHDHIRTTLESRAADRG